MTFLATLFPDKIYLGRDFWVPAFDVKIRQKDLPAETNHDIISVRYTDAIDALDTFELTVNNWDAETRDFKYTGAGRGNGAEKINPFEPGQEIELWMGYFEPTKPENRDPSKPDPLRLMLAGLITSITPSFPSSGQPTLKVAGQNVLRALLTKQDTKAYKDMKDSDIAETVGKRKNLKIGTQPVEVRTAKEARSKESPHEHVLQADQYDIVFLHQRAQRIGYDLMLKYESKGGKDIPYLSFEPSTKRPPVLELEWGRSLIQFTPTLSTTRQVAKVTVRFWNGQKKKVESVTVDRDGIDFKPLRDDHVYNRIKEGFRQTEDIIADQPFRDVRKAREFAISRLKQMARGLVSGKGSTIGTPDLRAGNVVVISGLGKTFSGSYLIKSTTHTIGTSGYITEFDATLQEEKK